MREPGVFYPLHLTGPELDVFLSMGWYRMGQGIFTTHGIFQEEQIFRVFWLRYNLQKLAPDRKSSRKIIDNNSIFQTTIKSFTISQEMEALYELYKAGIDFDAASSVRQWLYDAGITNVFDTYIIEVRDEGVLIAVGIFDKGKKAIAGIMNFYNPLYKKYSLGKYLMLLKIKYAQEMKIKWYYPGYIVPGYPKFDYKLFVDKLAAEIFIPELNVWQIYDQLMVNKLKYRR